MFGWPRSLFREWPAARAFDALLSACAHNKDLRAPTALCTHSPRLSVRSCHDAGWHTEPARVRNRMADCLEKVLSGASSATSSCPKPRPPRPCFESQAHYHSPTTRASGAAWAEGRPPSHARLLQPGCRYLRGSVGAPHPRAVIRGTAPLRPARTGAGSRRPCAQPGRQADRRRGTRPPASARGPWVLPIVAEVLLKEDAFARHVSVSRTGS